MRQQGVGKVVHSVRGLYSSDLSVQFFHAEMLCFFGHTLRSTDTSLIVGFHCVNAVARKAHLQGIAKEVRLGRAGDEIESNPNFPKPFQCVAYGAVSFTDVRGFGDKLQKSFLALCSVLLHSKC